MQFRDKINYQIETNNIQSKAVNANIIVSHFPALC